MQTCIWTTILAGVRLLPELSIKAKPRAASVHGLRNHQTLVLSLKSLHVTFSRRVFGSSLGQLENPQGFDPRQSSYAFIW